MKTSSSSWCCSELYWTVLFPLHRALSFLLWQFWIFLLITRRAHLCILFKRCNTSPSRKYSWPLLHLSPWVSNPLLSKCSQMSNTQTAWWLVHSFNCWKIYWIFSGILACVNPEQNSNNKKLSFMQSNSITGMLAASFCSVPLFVIWRQVEQSNTTLSTLV